MLLSVKKKRLYAGHILLVALIMLTVSACGFSPMYSQKASHSSMTSHLDQIYIQSIPDREGQYLRNALIDRFYRHGRPAVPSYDLAVAPLRETLTDLDITKSSDATRGQLRLDTKMVLSDKISGAQLASYDLVSITSYNILQSQFTTRVAEDNARMSALDDLARQIETRLALYFQKNRSR